MNKFTKTAVGLLGLAGAVGFGASSANALSFTVVVDKIELVKDADNYPNTATVVFEPRSGIGEGATRTVDLFDATQKLGTSYTLRTPGTGEYESMVVFFSSINVVSGAATYNVLSDFTTNSIFGTSGAHGVMVLGDDGDGTADSLQGTYAVAVAPMQSIIPGGTVTLPSLDFFLPTSAVTANSASTITVGQLPQPIPVVSQATDSASRANLLVDVDADTAFTAVTGFTNGASTVTVGLFDNVIKQRPLVSKTFTAPSPAAITQVEFIDAPNTTLYPLAWIDADSDGQLDVYEEFTFHSTTVATNSVAVSGTSDVSYTSMGSRDVLDTVSIQFGPRAITMTIDMPNIQTDPAGVVNNAWADDSGIQCTMTLDAGGGNLINVAAGDGADGSLTIVYALSESGSNQISRSSVFDIMWGADGAGTNDDIETGEVAFIGLASAGIGHVSATAGFSYAGTSTNVLTIKPIPLLLIDTFADNNNDGEWQVHVKATVEDDTGNNQDGTSAVSVLTENGGGGAGAAEDHNDSTLTVNLDKTGADGTAVDGEEDALALTLDDN